MTGKTYERVGVVEEILDEQTFSSGFNKREMILGKDINDDSKYPCPLKFTFKKDKTALLDSISKGQRVKVVFAIDGRKWDGPRGVAWFVDLVGLNVEVVDGEVPHPAEQKPSETLNLDNVSEDDMPF